MDAIGHDVQDGVLRAAVAVRVAPAPDVLAIDAALADLAASRDALGTEDHYVLADRQWFRADDALLNVVEVPGPAQAAARTNSIREALVTDKRIVERLISDRISHVSTPEGGRLQLTEATAHVVEELDTTGLSADGVRLRPDPAIFWGALVASIRSAAENGSRMGGEHTSPAPIADAVAALLGPVETGTVLDPFCGLGSFLWSVDARARESGVDLQTVGWDIKREITRLASSVGRFAPQPPSISTLDAFLEGPAHTTVAPRYVVSAPPYGMRLPVPVSLAGFPRSERSEVAAIALALHLLAPGGRAVLHLSQSWLNARPAEQARRTLATSYTVQALVGLPAGLQNQLFAAPTMLLVVDKVYPRTGHETFIASLADDWAEQLSPGGGALEAYLEHLGGQQS